MKPKINFYLFLVLFAPLLLVSCEEDDDDIQEVLPTELLNNGNLETGSTFPNGWFSNTPCATTSVLWTDEDSFSPSKSLKMSNSTAEDECFSFLGQSFNTDIPTGQSVTLRVRIKGALEGQGVSIAIRGDDTPNVAGNGEQFATTEGSSPISGTFDWTEYTISLNSVASTTRSLTVYLVYLPETTGDVFFDDISLTFE